MSNPIEILITKADNKRWNGKKMTYCKKTKIAKVGRTKYSLAFSVHQPNKEQGDYSIKPHILEDLKPIRLYRLDSDHLNCGKFIRTYEILNN